MSEAVIKQKPKQDNLLRWVRQVHEIGQLPHALLLSGPNGLGSMDTMLEIAMMLLCTDESNKPCGVCNQCKMSRGLQHPDLSIFFPTAKAGDTCSLYLDRFRTLVSESPCFFDIKDWLSAIDASNKSPNINKDILNEISSAFDYKSYLGGKKVMIIWGADYLGKEGNKILKLIEEPPENSHILLSCVDQNTILDTIKSRCQLLSLEPFSDKQLTPFIEDDQTPSSMLLDLAGGNLLELMKLQTGALEELQKEWLTYLRTCFTGKPNELIVASNQLGAKGKNDLALFLNFGMTILRNLIRAKVDHPNIPVAYKKLTALLSLEQLSNLTNRLNESHFHLTRNAHVKLLMTNLSIFISQLFRANRA